MMASFLPRWLILVVHWAGLAHSHVVLTYPGWRGNNLILNETFPFGMQWMYPCESCATANVLYSVITDRLPREGGGMQVSSNRTYWPIDGGAVGFQPGWFVGHETALIYVNVGLGEQPVNYSWPVTKIYLQGPTNNPYPGTVCLPKLTLPEEVRSRVKNGDLATIQVVEAAKHGAGMFTVGCHFGLCSFQS